jgi:hypothetical protein
MAPGLSRPAGSAADRDRGAQPAPPQAAGLRDEKIAILCRIAGVVDNGTFEAAGFAFSAENWRLGVEVCCVSPHPAWRMASQPIP